MSKARMTFRFENTRGSAAGQASAEAANESPRLTPPEEGRGPEREREAPNPSPRAAGEPAPSNVIPLRHYEFEVSEEPIVLEEKRDTTAAPLETSVRRIDANYPYDYGAWEDASSAEADELERLIRETDAYEPESEPSPERPRGRSRGGKLTPAPRYSPEETRRLYARLAADDEAADDAESGYWPGVDDRARHSRASAAARRRAQDGPAWWKVAGAVVGAIATGVLFGTFFLNFFTGDPPRDGAGLLPGAAESGAPSDAGTGEAEGGAVGGAEQPATAGDAGASDGAAMATAAIDLPERRMFLLQNGKFETLEAARALAEEMKSKGLAATIEEGDGFYVYAGVTSDRDAALRAGVQLQAEGVEVYVKPYELPSVQQVRWAADGSAEALGGYVGKGSDMVRMIGDLTLVHLEEDAPIAPEKATLEKLRAEHLAMSELMASASEGLPAEAQPMLKRMDDAVRNAVVAIEEYGANPAHAYLWSAQSGLMDYLIAEKQLLMTIATM